MGRKKSKRTGKKNGLVRKGGGIFVSPDGGETIYEQLPNGDRILVEKSQLAKDREQETDEVEMIGVDAIKLRRKYPALAKAWKQYKTIWHMVQEQ